MRKERQVLVDKIISMNEDIKIANQALKDGLMSDWEVAFIKDALEPDKEEVEKSFLATYATEAGELPTWAANLGIYDQHLQNYEAGVYGR